MFCTKCGSPIELGSAFCTVCGAAQQIQPQQPQYQQPQYQDPYQQAYQQPQQVQYQDPYQQSYQQPQYQQPQAYQQPYQPQHQAPYQQPYQQPQYQQPAYQPPQYQVPYQAPAAPVGAMPGMPVQSVAAVAGQAAKAGMGAGMKFLVGMLVVAALALGAWFIMEQMESPEDKINATVEKLEYSFNNLDVNGMLECFDPSVSAMYDAAMSLTGSLMGSMLEVGDMTDLLTGMTDIAPFLPDEIYDEIGGKPVLDITVNNIVFTSDTSADVTMTFSVSQGGQSEQTTETLSMMEIDDEWVISIMGMLW